MAHFTKPANGSWTEHFGLDTGPVSYDDSISPEHYELERDAIFRKTWLNVGRVEQIPRKGSYFTKELDAARTSVVVIRVDGDDIRAYQNICRHRGNKLVWNDYPGEETSGVCRQFTCKYHGWRYDLEGALTFVQQEDEFFDLDKADYGLVSVRCEVWEGFIWVNFDADATPVRDYLGTLGAGLEGYPFGEMTQVGKFRAEVGANWKLFIDAFAEFYHAPVLHAKQSVSEEASKLQGVGYEALHYDIDGPHSMVSSWGGMSPPKDLSMVKPIERVIRSGLFGPWDAPDIGELPPGVNPARHPKWGTDTFVFFPNFMVLIWKPNWYLTYHYWPTSYNTHIFEGACYFVPPENARQRIQQEMAAVTFKEFALQDGNTLEATQTMLESGAVTHFPLNDQEVLLRHLHTTARKYVDDHQKDAERPVSISAGPEEIEMPTLPAAFADLEPFADWALPTADERYGKRLASTMDELQAFYDAALPRTEEALDYLDQLDLHALPEDAERLMWVYFSLMTASFPVEAWRQPRVPDSGSSSFDCYLDLKP